MDCRDRHGPPVDGHEESTSFGTAGSMASYLQSSPPKSLAVPPGAILLPPPMSLRVRESDSISLKQIFDQRMMGSAAASKSEQECGRSNLPGPQLGGSHRSCPDRRKPNISQLDLTCSKAQASTFANPPAGFGSPISAPALVMHEPEPMNTLCSQQNCTSYARVSPSKPAAQMTIFYAGSVDVFDDVPAEEAHAIMVLARKAFSSNSRCHAPSTGAAMAASAPSGRTEVMVKEVAPSILKTPPPQPETTSSISTGNLVVVKNVSSTSVISAQNLLSIASPPPSPAPLTCPVRTRTTQVVGVPAQRSGGIELPLSRKASLQRFLEKRKDRAVQVQQLGADQQDPIEEKGEEGAEGKVCNDGKTHDDPPPSLSSTRLNLNSSSSSREDVRSIKRTKPDDEDDEGSSSQKRRSLNEHRFFP